MTKSKSTRNILQIILFSICILKSASVAYTVGDGQCRHNHRTEVDLWSKFNNSYPDTISISNFTTRTNQVSAVEIISEDQNNVFNPNFLLSNESVLDIGIGNVISFDIDYT